MCDVRAQDKVVPGEICITLNQSQALVTNPIGSWGVLLGIIHHTPVHSVFYCPNFEKSAGALMPDQEDVLRGYCVIDEFVTEAVGLATFVAEPSLRPMFPIAEKFSELEMYVGL